MHTRTGERATRTKPPGRRHSIQQTPFPKPRRMQQQPLPCLQITTLGNDDLKRWKQKKR